MKKKFCIFKIKLSKFFFNCSSNVVIWYLKKLNHFVEPSEEMSSKKLMEEEIEFIDNKSNNSLENGLILIDEEIKGYFI